MNGIPNPSKNQRYAAMITAAALMMAPPLVLAQPQSNNILPGNSAINQDSASATNSAPSAPSVPARNTTPATNIAPLTSINNSSSPIELKPPIIQQSNQPAAATDSPDDLDRRTSGSDVNARDVSKGTFFEREQEPKSVFSKSVASPNALQSKPIVLPRQKFPAPSTSPLTGVVDNPSEPQSITTASGKTRSLESIELKRPELSALITVSENVSPLALDATGTTPVSFQSVLAAAVQHNLDIADYRTQTEIQKWTYLNACSKFLPDVNMGYQKQFVKGDFFFPFQATNSASAAAATTATGTASTTSGASSKFLKISTPFTIMSSGFTYHAYQGGKVMFGALENHNRLRAARAVQHATLSNTLLDIARSYYRLLLEEAYLQIRIRAVATDAEQVRVNTDLEANGLATNLDVLQSRTQLSRDRVSLIDQQRSRRVAAIQLADTLNMSMAGDLVPAEHELHKVRLIERNVPITQLLEAAVDNRPELKQYEELRRAAKKAIVVAAAPLSPKINIGGNVYGIGPNLADVQAIFQLSFAINFTYGGLGMTDWTNIQTAKWRARQALVQANKEFNTIIDQTRTAYIDTLTTEKKIDETENEVESAEEELRLAKIRFENGLGTNLDIITAQRDRTTAYLDRALAIANYNIAEVQMLHDMGTISVSTLSAGKPIAMTPTDTTRVY
jgi:outer membrane protein TolC